MFVHAVSDHDADGVVAGTYDRIRATLRGASGAPPGSPPPRIEIPEVYRISSLVPAHLSYAGDLLETILAAAGEQAVVPATLPNFAVAAFSACHFCAESIGAALRLHGVSADLLDAIARDLEGAGLAPAQEALLCWVRTYTQRSSTLTAGDIGELPAAAVGAPADAAVLQAAQRPDLPKSWWTMAREELDVTTLVLDNRSYAVLNVELERVGASAGGARAKAMLDLSGPDLDFVSLATGMGIAASAATTCDELADQLATSFATPGPAIIDCQLQAAVPR